MRKLFSALSIVLALQLSAQELPKNYSALVSKIEPQLIQWRQHFHQNPELSNREFKTGAYIADYLKSIGLEVKYPIAKTGVVAILKVVNLVQILAYGPI